MASKSEATEVLKLKDKGMGGPKATYVGGQVEGSPKMSMVMGPHIVLGIAPRSINYNVKWVAGMIRPMCGHGLTRAERWPEAVQDWPDHVKALGEGLLSNEIDQLDGLHQSQRRGKDGADRGAVSGEHVNVSGAVRYGGRRASGDEVRVDLGAVYSLLDKHLGH